MLSAKINLVFLFVCLSFSVQAQKKSNLSKKEWVDSVFSTLTPDEKIGQLIVVRMSSMDGKTGKPIFFTDKIEELVVKYKIGGVCLFQGGPVSQAIALNRIQQSAALPLLVSIDAETGLGMRMDSVRPLPRQMMLGAMRDPSLLFEYGKWVGQQHKRAGIHMNYAPVVDINNNPANPVINDRSFGEDKQKVADYAIRYMKGMQAAGILTCAKHFPGHGDVDVDSHLDLPIINKTKLQLDSLELFPFKKIVSAGVDAIMVAHLFIPAIDNTANRATSLSYNNITGLLQNELGFKGLVITDALEMKGVSKFFPGGTISKEALIAGNDLLCLPENITETIAAVKEAIQKKKLSWDIINQRVSKLLEVKYDQGLHNWVPVSTVGIVDDLNRETDRIRREVAIQAITLLQHNNKVSFPIAPGLKNKVAYVALGTNKENAMSKRMREDYNSDVYYFDYKADSLRLLSMLSLLPSRYDAVVVGVHQLRRYPAGKFGISDAAIRLVEGLRGKVPSTVFLFGNPYASTYFQTADNLITCYEDDPITQEIAADILNGLRLPQGILPVTVNKQFPVGFGVQSKVMPVVSLLPGMDMSKLLAIDTIATEAISKRATPGMVVLVAKDGKIAYHKAFGYYTYDNSEPVTAESIFDMASVTKICATTISIMKLYDEGKLSLEDEIGKYIPWLRGTDKERITVRNILLHQAGLKSFIPFYRETIDTSTGIPKSGFYSKIPTAAFSLRVSDSMYLKTAWRDTIYKRIANSPLTLPAKMIYSDNDFIFLGLIVEAISGMTLHDYAKKNFYDPMGLVTTGFRPRDRLPLSQIVPTENEKIFRRQLIRGDVHDPGAALFGGIAGHAGLFSNAYDLAVIMQMLMNKGVMNGKRYLSDTTIARFTAYGSEISHRALGFDKPYKDNATRQTAYPAASASPLTFGHTGFTGIGAWADPEHNLIFLVLSNRVHPDGSNVFLNLNVRPRMHEAVYQSLRN
ncbi:MAG: hypothetical protein RL335_835 [Bacteroidota bacterium]|jgi:beta-glucosidase-like glycosyl hydrolase/CubicO group peptidase (beta-lactamase class C family)